MWFYGGVVLRGRIWADAKMILPNRRNYKNFKLTSQVCAHAHTFTTSGMYTTYSVEFDVSGLALNAVLQSIQILESDGADGNFGLSNSDPALMDVHLAGAPALGLILFILNFLDNLDTSTPSFKSFRVLRDLVKGWSKEWVVYRNPLGRLMLTRFYTWLTHPASKLYDPAIASYVHSLMTKSIREVAAEVARIGGRVVWSGNGKLVVVTQKTKLENVEAYAEFLIKQLKGKGEFIWIQLTATRYFSHLLWMDRLNYGAIEATPSTNIDSLSSNTLALVEMKWTISDYLPPFVRQYFKLHVADFIRRIHDTKKSLSEQDIGEGRRELEWSMIQSLVKDHFTLEILSSLTTVQQTVGMVAETDGERAAIAFPKHPGCMFVRWLKCLGFCSKGLAN